MDFPYLAKTKAWYDVSYKHFERWATKSDIPWRAIKPHLDDALTKLPMNEEHKQKLRAHWQRLNEGFWV